MKSGNLNIAISDHLPSFLIVLKDNQNHMPKQQNLYTRKTKTLTSKFHTSLSSNRLGQNSRIQQEQC